MTLPASTASTLSYDNKDCKYSVFYFKFHALGACPRALLCFGEAQWDNKVQDLSEWPQIRDSAPFGTLPILLETDLTTGKTIEIPESGAIERYLARMFGLLGDTAREEVLSDVFYAQAVILDTKYIEMLRCTFEEIRMKALEQFLGTTLPNWVKACERHLKENGNTGHFVDNKFTLADIKTAVVLDTYLALDSEKVLNPTNCPCLWKLKKTVDTHPTYAAWRKSEQFKDMDEVVQAGVGALMPLDIKKSHIFS
ncbi:hypothetical protein BC939DRAFT_489255 [Gamsiella multidivaricata]|uniref:uncharacterized protein n=1 Tax=Gamsiella multidivaricata TaxID=101098 RepID=UPI00221EB911|nr:uncharacterized protein BC939DRAFT_489255 [Gamsiella multidivaricata]KAG0353649.1 hypothetical protein BGZ54_002146 [Gamsiella multidivaricata]KAI7831482.1 hypothetical protein BC939DRAFT_489255 [Gamsiella multidivaricata]